MTNPKQRISVERLTKIEEADLQDLCNATEAAIHDGNGFGWLKPPRRSVLEAYWKGVILVPERDLYVGWLDGRIVGSIQLLRPSRHNEAQAHMARLTTFFIAPSARGLGLAREMLNRAEETAREEGFRQLELDVRETQMAAIQVYERHGYIRWGERDAYAIVDDKPVKGYFYSKALDPKKNKKKDA
ncbi:MAG: N-acetyltransferase family protein [Minwuia sp.]|uniref:GNAT family N-acetyltransferase n=1 Tax=Minwuia sp. TaxID=2493630 RepID=UPI003A8B0914